MKFDKGVGTGRDNRVPIPDERNRGFLDSILNGFSDSVFVIDRDYRILEINDHGKERFHLTQQEALKKHCYEVSYHRDSPCDDGLNPCPLRTVFETGNTFDTEHIHQDADGNDIIVDIHAIPLFDDDGEVGAVIEFNRNITEQRQAAAELQAEKAQTQQYLNIVGVMVVALDDEQKVTMINRMGCKMLRYRAEEIIGKNWFTHFIPKASREKVRQAYSRLMIGELKSVEYFENKIVTSAGKERIIAWHNALLRDNDDRIVDTLASGRDITEHNQIMKAIEKGKRQWEHTFDTVPDQIMIVDPDGMIERVNKSCAEYFNVEPGDMVETNCNEWYHCNHSHIKNMSSKELAQKVEPIQNKEYHNPDNNTYLSISVTPMLDEADEAIGMVHVARDITEQKKAAEVLREANETKQREAMFRQIEQIFSAIRHEIGNALNTLKTTLNVLYTNIDRFPVEKRNIYFQRALDTFKSAEQMLRVLKEYQKFDELEPEKLHLDRFITEKIGILIDNAKSAGVKLNYKPGSHDKITKADRDALMRIILNLVDNAIHATQDCDNPTITISTHRDSDWLYLRVSDNGVGIAEEEQYKVFAPLYTTRRDGSGLGLAIVQKLMQQMGGAVRLDSKPGKGAKFEIRFPAA